MKKFALLGNHIDYSLSPQLHQMISDRMGKPCNYEIVDAMDSFYGALERIKDEGYEGFNITIPYKEEMLKHVDEVTEHAKGIGSINTVTVNDGKWVGDNTDGLGFVKGLGLRGCSVTGMRVLVIGAGGAARGIVHALLTSGVKQVLLYNRSTKKRNELFSILSKQFKDHRMMVVDDYSGIVVDLVINTTPVGGPHFPGERVIDLEKMTVSHVADIVYKPHKTPLIEQATALDKKVFHGIDMLVCQAVLAQEIWQGETVSDEAIEEIIHELIG
ncbi:MULTISPECIES: shikimate dehydrogenase [unclassified Fusibacter]|uniref:shikimate dehydrogenase n=1 Tax=unclassified Fusibacter TaxID=2624464 RepID=UPI0010105787|nr:MULTISPECIES: shikimate dehydrogenase [unclassified Fusibacter]MCK8059949.1 shikimate dehydrogenase [Fusibacter sp. A2]NPE22091.1 shikimate dehydrogenase [Fusibacter sp. A1]RXV60870.1 shikimate dehydrogenase [Fusibacter sp. A1]